MSHILHGFPTTSNTDQAVQPQEMARGLKIRNYEIEELYYLYRENINADQIRGNYAVDLHLFFLTH